MARYIVVQSNLPEPLAHIVHLLSFPVLVLFSLDGCSSASPYAAVVLLSDPLRRIFCPIVEWPQAGY